MIMSKANYRINKLVTVAILSALGTILMQFEIPWIVFWLKFDLSDVVVYLTAVIYGPIAAIVVAFVKSLVHYLRFGGTFGIPINQFIAFVASLAYALPLYYFTKLFAKGKHQRLVKIIPLILSSLAMTFIMVCVNFWLTEVFIRILIAGGGNIASVSKDEVLNFVSTSLNFSLPRWVENTSFLPKNFWFWFIVISYVPFNLVKTALTSTIYYVLSFRLEVVLERFRLSTEKESILLRIKNEPQNNVQTLQ